MNRKWLCWLGIHDWVTIRWETAMDVSRKLAEAAAPPGTYFPCSISFSPEQYLSHRVCIRCGREVDEIADYVARKTRDEEREQGRLKAAQRIVGERTQKSEGH